MVLVQKVWPFSSNVTSVAFSLKLSERFTIMFELLFSFPFVFSILLSLLISIVDFIPFSVKGGIVLGKGWELIEVLVLFFFCLYILSIYIKN